MIPVNADIQQLDVIVVPEEGPRGESDRVKGIGELGNVGTAAAVANAVYYATGIRCVKFRSGWRNFSRNSVLQ